MRHTNCTISGLLPVSCPVRSCPNGLSSNGSFWSSVTLCVCVCACMCACVCLSARVRVGVWVCGTRVGLESECVCLCVRVCVLCEVDYKWNRTMVGVPSIL